MTLSLVLRLGSPEDFTLPDVTGFSVTLGIASLPAFVLAAAPLLSWLGRRVPARAVLAATGGVVLSIPAAALTAVAVNLGSMPVGEAALFTGAFMVEGLFFGALAAVGRGKRGLFRGAACAAALAASIPAVACAIPFARDRLRAARRKTAASPSTRACPSAFEPHGGAAISLCS